MEECVAEEEGVEVGCAAVLLPPLLEPELPKAGTGPGIVKDLKPSAQMSGNLTSAYNPGILTKEDPEGDVVPLPVTLT